MKFNLETAILVYGILVAPVLMGLIKEEKKIKVKDPKTGKIYYIPASKLEDTDMIPVSMEEPTTGSKLEDTDMIPVSMEEPTTGTKLGTKAGAGTKPEADTPVTAPISSEGLFNMPKFKCAVGNLACTSPTSCKCVGGGSPTPVEGNLAERIVVAHNKYRAKVGHQPLTWDPALATRAQTWVNKIAKEKGPGGKCVQTHSPGGAENISWDWVGGVGNVNVIGDPEKSTKTWYEECKHYDPTNPLKTGPEQTGHFTQVMWKDASKIGCGYSKCSGETAGMFVCNYDKGNMRLNGGYSLFDKNVKVPPSCPN